MIDSVLYALSGQLEETVSHSSGLQVECGVFVINGLE